MPPNQLSEIISRLMPYIQEASHKCGTEVAPCNVSKDNFPGDIICIDVLESEGILTVWSRR